jgi:hypothetical protein
MFGKHNPLNIKVKLRYLDIPETGQYAGSMSGDQIYADLLKVISTSLAVKFGDVTKMLPNVTGESLKQHLYNLEKLGLVKVHSRNEGELQKEGELQDDAVLSITADGSKKASAIPSRAVAAVMGQLSRI